MSVSLRFLARLGWCPLPPDWWIYGPSSEGGRREVGLAGNAAILAEASAVLGVNLREDFC